MVSMVISRVRFMVWVRGMSGRGNVQGGISDTRDDETWHSQCHCSPTHAARGGWTRCTPWTPSCWCCCSNIHWASCVSVMKQPCYHCGWGGRRSGRRVQSSWRQRLLFMIVSVAAGKSSLLAAVTSCIVWLLLRAASRLPPCRFPLTLSSHFPHTRQCHLLILW